MNNYNKLNNIVGWGVFLIASFVYLSTIEPTVSFWDCGEYIATAYKLEVGHPPGAPLFQLFGRIFTLFAEPGTSQVAVAAPLPFYFFFGPLQLLEEKCLLKVRGTKKAKCMLF